MHQLDCGYSCKSRAIDKLSIGLEYLFLEYSSLFNILCFI